MSDEQIEKPTAAPELPPDRSEPSPKVAPLVEPLDTDGTKLDAPPLPPVADAGGKVPRLLHQNERAPAGLKRFKVRCDNYHPQPVRYVLAKSERQARDYYLQATGLDRRLALLERSEARVEPPLLVLTALPD